jgi:gliding motility-associated-like protein
LAYAITDNNGNSSSARVYIHVNPVDSDSDGIPDFVETSILDTDNDSLVDSQDTDSDDDGIPDVVESGMTNICGTSPVDADADNIPDYRDEDSDNDGVADKVEGTDDCDNDGVVNYLDAFDNCQGRLQISETFSPNGDGINDFFVIPAIVDYPQNEFTVFNRWGAKVYSKVNYDNTWDGRSISAGLNSDVLPEDTYFYVLKLGDGTRVLKGFIYIKR